MGGGHGRGRNKRLGEQWPQRRWRERLAEVSAEPAICLATAASALHHVARLTRLKLRTRCHGGC
eukprot:6180008-Pleurochrysis_carterae.AAC.1